MFPIMDRASLYLLGGLIVGYLESNGLLDQHQHAQNVDTAQTVLGGLIIAFSLLWSMIHHTIIEKNRIQYEQPDTPAQPVKTGFSFQPLFDKLGSFMLSPKKPLVQAAEGGEPNVQ